jgi:hypothetical protein
MTSPASPTSAQPGTKRLVEAVLGVGRAEDAVGALAGADALAEVAALVERGQDRALGIGTERVEVARGLRDVGHDEPVVRRPGADHPPDAIPAVHLPAAQLDARPVRVIRGRERRLDVIGRRAHRLGDGGMAPVGAHDETRALGNGGTARAPADAGHAVAVEDQLVEGEALAHLGAGVARGVDEELVEQRAARAVDRVGALELREAPAQDDGPWIEAHLRRRGRAGSEDAVEDPPAPQPRDAGHLDLVGGERVAREPGAVDGENLQAAAREVQCRRGAGDAGPDHDDVVHAP